jgi:hypothetical protein
LKLTRDGWTGLVVTAASLFLFWLTLELKDNPLVPVGPGFYPRIILGITAVLAAALLIFSFFAKPEEKKAETFNYPLVVACFAIFGLYVGSLPYLGFRLSTFIFVSALQGTLEPPKGVKGWAIVAATALITTVVSYYLFEGYLHVLLPRGRWTGL